MTSYNILEYYYHRDHWGNNCVVWDATNDSVAQHTWYYASGTPMSISTAQGTQPYKYNGKEYVEVHGYDTYDYGFRGYYATIGRFTSIDPLTERTPWQSPYTYANNNWVNLIDYVGLFGTSFSQGSCNWVAVDNFAKVLGSDMNSSDKGVYLVDDDWDGTYDGLLDYPLVGWQMPGINYIVGGYYDFIAADLSGAYLSFGSGNFGFMALPVTPALPSKESSTEDIIADIVAVADITNEIIGNFRSNEFFWIGANGQLYFRHQRHQQGGWAYSYSQASKRNAPRKLTSQKIGSYLSIITVSLETIDIVNNRSIKPSNIINLSAATFATIATIPIVAMNIPVTASIIVTATVVYAVLDVTTGIVTGKSLGTHIDELCGGAIYSW